MRPFTPADAALFFGRDAEARRLAQRVADAPGAGLVAVVGPSGSGKSSLLAAGLLGRECSRGGLLDGVRGVALAPTDLAAAETDAPLIVVDQFEDVLALPSGPYHALAGLVRLAERAVVVLGVRSDAFAQLADFSALRAALERPLILAPMTDADVRAVIEEPTRTRGVTVEPGLTELILRDLTPGDDGPVPLDALPLLSNALLVTWGVGQGRGMSVADYQRSGGLTAAVESLSEGVFAELSPADQERTRSLFLRLVRLNDRGVIRQRVPIAQLADDRPIVDAFVSARILTASYDDVQISHDALLTQWPRLAGWISDGLDDLRVRGNLARATALWLDHEKATDALLPVDRLPAFASLTHGDTERTLSPDEREFLDASRAHFTSQLDAEKRTSAKLRVRSRAAMGMTAVAAALALIAGVSTVQARDVQAQAQSRQVAVQSGSVRAQDPNLQAQMAVAGAAVASTLESRTALLDATAIDMPRRWPGVGSAVLAVSADQQVVARGDGAGKVTLWRGSEIDTSPGSTFVVDAKGHQIYGIAQASVGTRRLLAVGGELGFAALWDITGVPRLVTDLSSGEVSTFALAFDPTAASLAMGRSDGSVVLWTLADLDHVAPSASLSVGAGRMNTMSLAFDPGRKRLYAGGPLDHLAAWDVSTPTPTPLPDLPHTAGANLRAQTLAVSPDGRWLLAGMGARMLVRWDLTSGTPAALPPAEGFPNWFNSVSFSADSRTALVGDSDQKVRVLDAETLAVQRVLPGPSIVTGARFLGDRVVATSADGTLWVWSAQPRVLRSSGSSIYQLMTDAKGSAWLSATDSGANKVLLWSLKDGVAPMPSVAMPTGTRVTSGSFVTADGRFLYAGTRNGEVVRWSLTDAGASDPTVQQVLPPGSYVASIATDPSGTLLATAQYTGESTTLNRIGPDGALTPLATLKTPIPQSISFDSTGKLLQIGLDRGVELWNVKDPANPVLAATIPTASLAAISTFGNASPVLGIGTDAGEVSVWDVSVPATPRQVQVFHEPRSAMYSLAFSPDDHLLVGGGGDEVFWGWDLRRPADGALFDVSAHAGRTTDGRFIANGRFFVGVGSDGSVRLWTLDADAARTAICANRGTPLTADEWARYLPGITPFDPCAGR